MPYDSLTTLRSSLYSSIHEQVLSNVHNVATMKMAQFMPVTSFNHSLSSASGHIIAASNGCRNKVYSGRQEDMTMYVGPSKPENWNPLWNADQKPTFGLVHKSKLVCNISTLSAVNITHPISITTMDSLCFRKKCIMVQSYKKSPKAFDVSLFFFNFARKKKHKTFITLDSRHPYKTDISVLLLFHARADHFSKVWEEVRKARPARLFLYQDGPRMMAADGSTISDVTKSKDWQGIQKCRELVRDEMIDWQCEVHRLYQEKNFGCDPSGFMSQRWAFSLTEKCMVLEDDVVPSQSFFPFCKEMLDRYEDDERITMIAGFNVSKPSHGDDAGNGGASYFFTRAFSIWGWASWARVVNNWDGDYGFVKDPQQFAQLQDKVRQYGQRKDMPAFAKGHAESGIPHFETIFWSYMLLHDGLAIMPARNQINNIGLDGGTHYSTQLDLQPKRLRWQFIMPRYELSFPLDHPTEVKEFAEYQRQYYLMNAWNNPCRKVQYSLEELWLNLRHGNIRHIVVSIKNRIRKTFN